MRDDVAEALEAACRPLGSDDSIGQTRRYESVDGVRHALLRLIRDMPDDLTIAELREELEP